MGNEICVCVYVLSGLYLYCSQLKEFKVIGRRFPTEKNKNPTLYRMRIFAPDEVAAKSRFWYFMKKLRKIKKTNGQLVYIAEVINPIPHSRSYIILIPILHTHSSFFFPILISFSPPHAFIYLPPQFLVIPNLHSCSYSISSFLFHLPILPSSFFYFHSLS